MILPLPLYLSPSTTAAKQQKKTKNVVLCQIWRSGCFTWAVQPLAYMLLTPDDCTVSVQTEVVHMLSAGLLNSAGQLTPRTAGSWLWLSQWRYTAEKSFNINKCHIHILDAFPCMIMRDVQVMQSQRSVLSFIMRCVLELFLFVVLQSHEISNQIAGSC